ncbi:MAG: potassium channel family protein [Actinomycetota bacterium]|nr:MAG: potassium channel family protein [Actinomycetota bacterium]
MAGRDRNYLTPSLTRWRERTDGFLLVLAIGTLPILLVEIKREELPTPDRHFIDAVNLLVLVAFAIDYFVELALASNRRSYFRHEWPSLLIVATQAIAILPYLGPLGLLRALRGVRGVRAAAALARLVAIGGAAAAESRAYFRRSAGNIALGAAGMTWLTSAAAFTLAEDVGDGGRVHSFFDALWWSTATITTVGYGDVYPVSAAGRIIGGFTMVVGISTFAVVTAKVAEWLVRGDRMTDSGPPQVVDTPTEDFDTTS